MKIFGAATLVLALLALASFATTQPKQFPTTLPSGEPIIMNALNIDRNWTTGITHLKGNVQIDIRQTIQGGRHYLVIRADEADFNVNTGEVIPRGNVRITPEERN